MYARKIVGFEEVDSEEYQTHLLSNPSAIVPYYQYSEWYSLWSTYFKTKPLFFKVAFDKMPTFYIGFVEERGAKGFYRSLNSGPVGTYSSIPLLNDLEWRALYERIKYNLSPQHINISWGPLIEDCISHKDIIKNQTYIIKVSQLKKDITDSWSRHHKRQLKESSSYDVYKSEDWNDWKFYFKLYQTQIKDLGNTSSNQYALNLFESLFSTSSLHRSLWMARKGNTILGGRLVLYGQNHASEWHAVHDKRYSGVAQRLVHAIISDVILKKIPIYDFNPSNNNRGVEEFKRRFGALQKPICSYEKYTYFGKMYKRYLRLRGKM